MCRFTAYLGAPISLDELLLRPDHSIIRQSYASKERTEPLNGDGFGVGWYVPELGPEPALYRNVRPAWADTNMAHIAPRTRTGLFFAHVRAATPGSAVNEHNCHPFVHDRLMFMHNGRIGAHNEVQRKLREELPDEVYFSIQGTTDSEHLFAAIRHALGPRNRHPTADELAGAASAGLLRVERIRRELGFEDKGTTANLALSDGRSLVAIRYASEVKDAASLYMGQAKRFQCERGMCVSEGPGEQGSVLISSEALWQPRTDWEKLPENHVIVVHPDHTVEFRELPSAA